MSRQLSGEERIGCGGGGGQWCTVFSTTRDPCDAGNVLDPSVMVDIQTET